MSVVPASIPRDPPRRPALDYYRLRRAGIGFIEEMASERWTDFNTHDPGITLLEECCYAMTELAYRAGWDIKDLLAPAPGAAPAHQAFFSAAEILTVNPVTPDDFRRLLIGLDAVRNAWLFCKECACDVHYYAWCKDEQLRFGYRKPAAPVQALAKVAVRGLYDVVLELEADAVSGDLNDRKIERSLSLPDAAGASVKLVMELRFPQWELARPLDWAAFLAPGEVGSVKLLALGASKAYNVLGDAGLDDAGRDRYLRTHWNRALYLSLEVVLAPAGARVTVQHAALHLFGDNAARQAATVAGLALALEDAGADGFVAQYRGKARKVAAALRDARRQLHTHRNLDEDYCRIGGVAIEDVAVCVDLEVAPAADIELVQAQAWFRIERYFNPPVPFHSLQELLDQGLPVEEIFNGPVAANGFLKADELAGAGLKTVLRGSDIITLLMAIDGVLAVNGLLLSKYDAEGNIMRGDADPLLNKGMLVFDPDRSSAAWQLFISAQHQPRLYFRRSRFLFYKNGLPFLPRMDEAQATLLQLRGEAERPRIGNATADLVAPRGTFRDPAQYAPLQSGLPRTYGVGRAGLPSHASPLRRAQARQLQAYLMVFEQLLANGCAQLAHTADLFALDPALAHTYFAGRLDAAVIGAYDEVVSGLSGPALATMLESPREFRDRRNRFLDHLLARFGEDFNDYALLLSRWRGRQEGSERLIGDKIGFLNAYPVISRDRARAFDYTYLPCAPDNVAGIQQRVSLLLGYPDLHFSWTMATPAATPAAPPAVSGYTLRERAGPTWLAATLAAPVTGADAARAIEHAWRGLMARMTQPAAWQVVASGTQFQLTLNDIDGVAVGAAPSLFPSSAKAADMRDELLAWSANGRAIVVEHVLLRPKFAGDALFPACPEGACHPCDQADPYSFRLSFVMPGWTAPFNTEPELRRFAERTIRQELPSHLLAKICWVGNDGFVENPCDPVIAELAALIEAKGRTGASAAPTFEAACSCAKEVYARFSKVFNDWYRDKTLDFLPPAALHAALDAAFATQPAASTLACAALLDTALFAQLRARMVAYFEAVATRGWQFERFSHAWCTWLNANARFDWTVERLQARVEAVLAAGLAGAPALGPAAAALALALALCRCAAAIVAERGEQFDAWMDANIQAGKRPAAFGAFTPAPVALCPGLEFAAGTGARLEALLAERYGAYTEVSYWLRIVLRLLAGLSSTYPGATLHDCDDGSDVNPVRLGSTTLGAAVPGRARRDA